MLYSNINNTPVWIYVYNIVYSTCYITYAYYAIYHTFFAYILSIPWMLYNSPKCYIAPPVMPDD